MEQEMLGREDIRAPERHLNVIKKVQMRQCRGMRREC